MIRAATYYQKMRARADLVIQMLSVQGMYTHIENRNTERITFRFRQTVKVHAPDQ